MSTFKQDLENLINRHSMENGSNTPDFILAEYLQGCLTNFNSTMMMVRGELYGINQSESTAGTIIGQRGDRDLNRLKTLDSFLEAEGIKTHCEDVAASRVNHHLIENEVRKSLDVDPNYPLGEKDAMKWAIAWRLIRDKNNIDANGGTDEWMTTWFANAMAASPDNVFDK